MVAMDAQSIVHAIRQLDDTTAVMVFTQVLQERPELAPPIVTFAVPDLTYPPSKVLTERRCRGSIKGYSSDTGFGFIECEELAAIFECDVFLHSKQNVNEHPNGTQVSFAAVLSKDNKPQAFDIVKESDPVVAAMPGNAPAIGGMGQDWSSMSGMMPGMAGMQGMQGMGGMPAMPTMPGMASMQGAMGGNPNPTMLQQMIKMGGKGAGGTVLGRFNGTIESFNPKVGNGIIRCADLQAQGHANEVFLNQEEFGDFDVGAQVSCTVFLNANGRNEAKDLEPGHKMARLMS